MTNQQHYDLLKKGVDVWNAWREKHQDVRPDLSHANLSDVDLRDTNLFWANLTGANLTGADLTRAHLLKADLTSSLSERRRGPPVSNGKLWV